VDAGEVANVIAQRHEGGVIEEVFRHTDTGGWAWASTCSPVGRWEQAS